MIYKRFSIFMFALLCFVTMSCNFSSNKIGDISLKLPDVRSATGKENIKFTIVIKNYDGDILFNQDNLEKKVFIKDLPAGLCTLKVTGIDGDVAYENEQELEIVSDSTVSVVVELKTKRVITVLDYQDVTSPDVTDNNNFFWDGFEKTHPDIKIVREALFNQAFHQKTEEYVVAGKMPDVFYMWPRGSSTQIYTKKLAKDLTPFMKKDGIINDYKEVCVDPAQQVGGYVAEIPFGLTSTNCMIANTKVLKECGLTPAKTYDELKAQIPVLKAAGKELIIMANQDTWVMQSCLFSMVLGRYVGANWVDDVMAGNKKFNEQWFKDAVQMIKTMYDDGVLSQASINMPYGESPAQFAEEKGAYLIDGDWRCGAFMTDESTGYALIPPAKQASDIEFIQFPSLPGEKFHGTNSGMVGVGYGIASSIPGGSQKETDAWELVKWLSGPKVQQRRLETGAAYPSLNKGIDFSKLEPIVKKRADWYGTAKGITPVFDGEISNKVADVLNTKLQELGLGTCTVDEVCNEVQQAFQTAYPYVQVK